jgi:hypothetical protein
MCEAAALPYGCAYRSILASALGQRSNRCGKQVEGVAERSAHGGVADSTHTTTATAGCIERTDRLSPAHPCLHN